MRIGQNYRAMLLILTEEIHLSKKYKYYIKKNSFVEKYLTS